MSVPRSAFEQTIEDLSTEIRARLYDAYRSRITNGLPFLMGNPALTEFGTDRLEFVLNANGNCLSTTSLPQGASESARRLGADFRTYFSGLAGLRPDGLEVWRGQIGIDPDDFVPGTPLHPSIYVQTCDNEGRITWDGIELVNVLRRRDGVAHEYRLHHWRQIKSPELLDLALIIDGVFNKIQPKLIEQVEAAYAFVEALASNQSSPVLNSVNYEHTKDGCLELRPHTGTSIDGMLKQQLTRGAAKDQTVREQFTRLLEFFQNTIKVYKLRFGGVGLTVEAISLGPDPEDYAPGAEDTPETLYVLFAINDADVPVERFWLGLDANGDVLSWFGATGTLTQ